MIKINKDVSLDERGQNANIKFHVLDKETMNSYDFGYTYERWLFNVGLTDTISMNIAISDDGEGLIDILDDDFLQPYDFQNMIIEMGNNAPSIAKIIQKKVYEIMNNLIYSGIISGWNYGDYI